MDEKKLIAGAIHLLRDQDSPILKQELRYEADGTPYIVILQDQGIGGVKKFTFSPVEVETRLALLEALEAAKAEPKLEPEPVQEAKAEKPKAGAKAKK